MNNFSEHILVANKRGNVRPFYIKIFLAVAAVVVIILSGGLSNVNKAGAYGVGGGYISGTVTDSFGHPLQDVYVYLYNADGSQTGGITWGMTDANGFYSIGGLNSVSYKVEFTSGGGVQQYYDNESNLAASDLVTVTEGSTTTGINASLPAGYVSGTVTDSSGQPIQGISVYVGNNRGGPTVLTDSNGNYYAGGLAAGSYKVKFYVDPVNQPLLNYLPQYYEDVSDAARAESVNVTEGVGVTDINAPMLPGGSITGVITDSSGQPIPYVQVQVNRSLISGEDYNDYCYKYVLTDANGYYSAGSLITGSYQVSFSVWGQYYVYNDKPNGSPGDLVAVTSGSATNSINAVLSPPSSPPSDTKGSISGNIKDSSGHPVQGIYLVAKLSDGWSDANATTDAYGSYSFSGLTVGSYTVQRTDRFFDGGWAYYPDMVTVTEGNTTTGIDFVIPGGSFFGIVTDPSGQPVPHVQVMICPHVEYYSYNPVVSETDANGFFSSGGFPTGSYSLAAWGWGYMQFYNGKSDWESSDPVTVTEGNATTGVVFTLSPLSASYCNGTAPDLQLALADRAFWASFLDYTARRLSVNYGFNTITTEAAYNVSITGTANTNGITLATPVPIFVSNAIANHIGFGWGGYATLVYNVPPGVFMFNNTVRASAEDACGNRFNYPLS